MKYRKLRIAWSVGCVVACVLLTAWWVRSYGRIDDLMVPIPKIQTLQVKSFRGRLIWHLFNDPQLHKLELQIRIAGDGLDWAAYDQFIGNWRWIPVGATSESLVLPHWLFAVLSAVFAAVPWLRWPHRFSVRTLLIATTLVAVGLGLAVYALGN